MPCVRVRFITADDFVSAAIRKITGSLFSHVEFGTPAGTWIGAHAGEGVQERAADYCRPTREYIYEVPCTQAEQEALLSWARARIGTRYNYTDILGLLFQARRLTSPSCLICSQFCAKGLLEVFTACRVLNVLEDWAYRITPETLHLSPIFTGHLVKKSG